MDRTLLPPPWRARVAAALGTLKAKVTLAAVVTLAVGIGAISTLLVHRAELDTLRAQHRHELGEAARTAALLSSNVVDLQRDLQAAALQLEPGVLAEDSAVARFVASQSMLRTRFASIFVAALDGRMRALADSTGVRQPDINVADREYFRRTLAEGRPIISTAISGRASSEPVIVLSYPVLANGRVAAVLCGALRLTSRDLIAELVSSAEADGEALLVVTNAQGQVLAHPDRARVMKSLSEEPRLNAAFAAWTAQGSPVEPLGVNLPQPGELVSAAGVAGPNWMVWRVRSEAELLGPLRAARREAIGWAAGLVAILSIAVLGLLWRLLRPLALLEKRAEHLFDGGSDADAGWPDSRGEIGRLSRVLRRAGAERSRLEAVNAQVLRKLGSVMSAAPIGIAFTRDQRFELVSTEFCRLYGRSEGEFLGKPGRVLYASDADYERLGPLVRAAFQSGHAYVGDWQMVRADGSVFWGSLRGNPVDAADPAAGTIWTVGDVSDQKIAHEALAWSASHDGLTGLANRKPFEQRAAELVRNPSCTGSAAMIFVDLDQFKPINDTAGHAAGDAVLRAVATALKLGLRSTDLVARMGGDEFALLLEACTPEATERIAEGIRAAIGAIAVPWEDRTLRVGASLGIAWLEADTVTVDEWIAAADAACYAAKAAGRGVIRTNPRRAAPLTAA
ncbi:MAG: diguanylate cyclase [Burkholderiales bacterium]